MRRTDLITAAALAVLGLVVLVVVIPWGVAEPPRPQGLPPAFMPYVAATLATLAALGWLVELALRPARAEQGVPAPRPWTFIGAVVLVLAAALALMASLGFVAGGAALVGGMLALARARPMTIATLAVATPLTLWVVFARLLSTPLP